MKKLAIFICALSLLAISGCKKDNNNDTSATSGPSNKDMVKLIFQSGMAGYNAAGPTKSTYPINLNVDQTVNSSLGGNIHVTGSITGNITINDQTGEVQSGTMLLGFTETINDYIFASNGKNYTMNGDPYVSLAGTFTLLPGGNTFGTASSMEYSGGVKVTGDGFSKTFNFNLTIILNTNGTGGTVSGTINGESVNFSL
ncbi:MAG: hypothetical protein Q8867_04480 [Bacteroidota bacterium]|nr:hypothetical protein [Bacteroidota bacterium]